MKSTARGKVWGFVGRFTLIHVITYTAIAIVFLNIQSALPSSLRVGLEFFETFSMNLTAVLAQVIIGGVIALVLYPFYDIMVKGKQGWLVIFAALWGIVLLGSMEPKPGTIEGMLYTEITFFEHFLVLAAGALYALLFAWLFLLWERKRLVAMGDDEKTAETGEDQNNPGKIVRRYIFRYTLLHVLIYIIVGSLFYQISGYEEALATMEEFALWRPLENIIMPFVILFGQVIRGSILALLLYPFYNTYMKKQHGWLLLFGLLFGLKVLATIISVPETTAAFMQGLQDLKIGLPEITVQTLVFAWSFFAWEKRRAKKKLKNKKLSLVEEL